MNKYMNIVFFLVFLSVSNLVYADRNIDVMPSLGENPATKYSNKKTKKPAIKKHSNKVKGDVHKVLNSDINNMLRKLQKKISSRKHDLALNKKALKKVRAKERSKIKKKSKLKRIRMKRILGSTTH